MTDKLSTPEQVGKQFSEKWWADKNVHSDVYDDLVSKIKNPDYEVKCQPAGTVNRSLLACNYIINNVSKGSRILSMACGIGFNECCLKTFGYETEGFDVSETAIARAKKLANQLGQDPDMFYVADVSCISKMPNEFYDAVLAIGLFRYLDKDTHDMCYKNIYRILKPGGKFLVIHQNILFEMFALNDGTLRFWADVIEGFSDAPKLFGGKSVLQKLEENLKVPKRIYEPHSISRHMKVQAENPLTFNETASKYGFKLEKIHYPSTHLMPPFLEDQVDKEKLEKIKRKVYMDHIDDWRAMFIEYEFLAYLLK